MLNSDIRYKVVSAKFDGYDREYTYITDSNVKVGQRLRVPSSVSGMPKVVALAPRKPIHLDTSLIYAPRIATCPTCNQEILNA